MKRCVCVCVWLYMYMYDCMSCRKMRVKLSLACAACNKRIHNVGKIIRISVCMANGKWKPNILSHIPIQQPSIAYQKKNIRQKGKEWYNDDDGARIKTWISVSTREWKTQNVYSLAKKRGIKGNMENMVMFFMCLHCDLCAFCDYHCVRSVSVYRGIFCVRVYCVTLYMFSRSAVTILLLLYILRIFRPICYDSLYSFF